jgi:hypothetical protein
MSVAEQLFTPSDEPQRSVEDAITEYGVAAVLDGGEYRPDVAFEYRMRRIQEVLATTGVQTVSSAIYQRGRAKPLSYKIRRIDMKSASVTRLDEYR